MIRAFVDSAVEEALFRWTNADFQRAAADVALQQGFPRIGDTDGRQLADLLVARWSDILLEFHQRPRAQAGAGARMARGSPSPSPRPQRRSR